LRVTAGAAARIARTASRMAGVGLLLLATFALAKSRGATGALVAGLGVLLPSLGLIWLQPRSLRVSALWLLVLGVVGGCLALIGFETPTDDIHDPGFGVEYAVGCAIFTLVAWSLAYLAAATATIIDAARRGHVFRQSG
jgi:hypothetical protein